MKNFIDVVNLLFKIGSFFKAVLNLKQILRNLIQETNDSFLVTDKLQLSFFGNGHM